MVHGDEDDEEEQEEEKAPVEVVELPPPIEEWECGACTLINPMSADLCSMCESPRPADAG